MGVDCRKPTPTSDDKEINPSNAAEWDRSCEAAIPALPFHFSNCSVTFYMGNKQ